MKFIYFAAFLLLTGCSQPAIALERTLNSYAQALEHPANEELINRDLAGNALDASRDSQKLLREMGLRQKGYAQFHVLEISTNSAIACLDVSNTYFENIAGVRADLGNRAERLKLQVQFTQFSDRHIIRDFSLLGQSC